MSLEKAEFTRQGQFSDTLNDELEALFADANEDYVVVPVTMTANATALTGAWIPNVPVQVTAIKVGFETVPASTIGTVVLDVFKTGATSLLTGTVDLEALTDEIPAAATLDAAEVTLAATDMLWVNITSNNADATGGLGGVVVIEYIKV
jgi:hypothetical protein